MAGTGRSYEERLIFLESQMDKVSDAVQVLIAKEFCLEQGAKGQLRIYHGGQEVNLGFGAILFDAAALDFTAKAQRKELFTKYNVWPSTREYGQAEATAMAKRIAEERRDPQG